MTEDVKPEDVKRSGRGKKRSIKLLDNDSELEDTGSKRPRRACERSGCPAKVPICFARASEKCAGSSYTSRWYHVSQGEHFCNECFDHFYRSHKDGYTTFSEWKRNWSTHGKTEPKLMLFFTDQQLSYWCQCTSKGCHRWRQLSKDCQFTTELVARYKCGMSSTGVKKENQESACGIAEDARVEATKYRRWYSQVTSAPYLYNSPSAPFLTGYYPDGVGLSASDPSTREIKTDPLEKYPAGLIQPFLKDGESPTALSFHPDLIETDEQLTFSHFATENPIQYLGVRNLIIALWSLNINEWLTKERVSTNLLCRGLTRIRLVDDIDCMLRYLTCKSYINTGLISIPKHLQFLNCQKEVIIIGSGVSGIAAAKYLHNMGVKVKILEAGERSGGRIKDIYSLGQCVGTGAQLLIGQSNNPLAVISHQAGLRSESIQEHCTLMDHKGHLVDPLVDKRIDFHFNAMLDGIAVWRQTKDISSDVNLLDKFYEMHAQFKDESQLPFTEEEEQILQFHLANLEYACGAPLSKVSTLNWDQNESLPQFTGNVLILKDGYSQVLKRLSEGLDIQCNTQVVGINYTDDLVSIATNNGTFTAHKVLVTVPLSILKRDTIKFMPNLPDRKQQAIQSLGAGTLEKVALQFDKKFWKSKTDGDDFFGQVPVFDNQRGLFNVFYDLSTSASDDGILVTNVSGDSLNIIKDKSDKEVVQMCLETLRSLFPDETVPEPVNYLVTHWSQDDHIGMAYSYMPVGCDGSVYDVMAEEINEKIYFAGEATNRQFPQSATGAYLSGVREANKIVSLIQTQLTQTDT